MTKKWDPHGGRGRRALTAGDAGSRTTAKAAGPWTPAQARERRGSQPEDAHLEAGLATHLSPAAGVRAGPGPGRADRGRLGKGGRRQ